MTQGDETSSGKRILASTFLGGIAGTLYGVHKTFPESVFSDNTEKYLRDSRKVFKRAIGGGAAVGFTYQATKQFVVDLRQSNENDKVAIAAGVTASALLGGIASSSFKNGFAIFFVGVPLAIGISVLGSEYAESEKLIQSRFDTQGKTKLVLHNKVEELRREQEALSKPSAL
ncbi:hypothetical protein CYY_000029 [Polysphondylium violaceum]|uniref:Transmembrane protein n=1 Tax=Polysphondylium violaceum TaxID=133409 RepID=A0A8J4V612_9MYCE|nr:hypothetical protein CYY_000029 [Polysphondylium violaceum]